MEETALDSLLEHRKQFLGFLNRRVQDPALAEDLLQTAYMRTLQHESEVQRQESATGWFYRVLRNAVIDVHRRRSTETRALEAWARELEDREQPDAQTEAELCGCLRDIVAQLKPEYADLLQSVDLAEQPLREFAKSHGLTSSNAAVRAHRARAALRRQLMQTCGSCAADGCTDCSCPPQRARSAV